MSHIVTFFYNAVYYDDIVPTLRPHLYTKLFHLCLTCTSPHHHIVTFFYNVENYDDITPAIVPRLETKVHRHCLTYTFTHHTTEQIPLV
jgi:hypothetical protein